MPYTSKPAVGKEKSCLGCPSFMSATEVTSDLGKSIGGPVCRTKLIPLGRPNAPSEEKELVYTHMAKRCPNYGDRPPALDIDALRKSALSTLKVGMYKGDLSDTVNSPTVATTCYGCSHFIAPQDVAVATGWAAPICAKNGTLLLADRLNLYPRSCRTYSNKRDVDLRDRAELKEFVFFPEYELGFGKVDLHKMLAEKDAATIEPHMYPPDKEVTPSQRSKGIKSWRKIVDPEGYGSPIFLPVYDPDWIKSTHPELLENVPKTGDDEHPEWYLDHGGLVYRLGVMWMEMDETPALWGPAGVGKTELLRHMAWLMGLPFTRISITASSETDDLVGTKEFDPERGTYFRPGRIPRSWSRPNVLLLDEPNTGPDAIWQLIRPLTDDSRQMVLDQDTGQSIVRHVSLFFALAMNPAWDMKNVGTNTIGDADGSRLMHIFMDLPPEDIERQIIARRCSADGFDITPHLDKVMKIATQLRAMSSTGDLQMSWGLRPQIKVSRAMRFFKPTTAYKVAVTDYLEPRQADLVREVVASHYGS